MHRQFITTIAAASIAITGFSAAPARAGDQDVGAALAAILGLAIVGAVIKDKHDNRKARQQVHPPQHVAPVTRHKPQVKPLPSRASRSGPGLWSALPEPELPPREQPAPRLPPSAEYAARFASGV